MLDIFQLIMKYVNQHYIRYNSRATDKLDIFKHDTRSKDQFLKTHDCLGSA